jgi:RHS repeat-associated protein
MTLWNGKTKGNRAEPENARSFWFFWATLFIGFVLATSTATSTPTPTGTWYTATSTESQTPTVTATPTATFLPPEVELLRFEKLGTGEAVSMDGAQVTERLNVVGTASSGNLDHWELEYQPTNASDDDWVLYKKGTASVTNGVLALFDPTLLLNGAYRVRLTVYDKDGYYYQAGDLPAFSVDGNQKVGNFTLNFTDLDVPVSGIPMQVVRTYDSRNKVKGDFGVGWTLDIHNIQVQESGSMAYGWEVYIQSGGLMQGSYGQIFISPTQSHFVDVVLGSGKVYRFEPHFLAMDGQDVVPGGHGVNSISGGTFGLKMVPLYGTAPDCTLVPIDTAGHPVTDVSASGSPDVIPNDLTWKDEEGDYNPTRFLFTDETGRKYIVNTTSGLEQMTDLNGNKLKVDNAGIHWVGSQKGSKDILFTRDGSNRITQIKDPMGNVFLYTYNDGSGNLQAFKDPTMLGSQGVTYTYINAHDLLSINDPTGHTPIRTDYYPDGRIQDMVDAFGNKINYSYNLDAGSESVTNRLGKPTSYVYDGNGNVLQEVQYLNGSPVVTNYSYSKDGYNNKLTELLPGNGIPTKYAYGDANNPRLPTQVTDPNGNSTLYTYDSQGHVLITTDPRGIKTINTYDTKGNLSSSQVLGYQPTTYTYDANGNMTSQTDPTGIPTTYTYDNSGYMISQTVAYGRIEAATTNYAYDSNGNKVTETKVTDNGDLTTTYSYDAMNRLVETIYPDGTSTQTSYDSLGHVVGTKDQKKRDTSHFYDAQGRVASIVYTDKRESVYGYDNEGHRTSDTEYGTDKSPHSTTTKYDDLGRSVAVTYADGGHVSTTYYPQGWVEDTIDENGNDTHFVYDSAGRKTSQTTAYQTGLDQETDFGYDADGNQTTLTVAGQLQSTTQYDGMNRAATIVYPQPGGPAIVGPFITQYDNDGRKTGQVDQAGKTTSFTVDGLGRTTKVTQMGGLTTYYTFDQVGNQLTQVDANTHKTTYTADKMGRRKTRELPDGRKESYNNYDDTGNLTSKTDFANNGFTYGYTTLNDRLTSVSGPGIALSTGYDGFLRRYSMTDASGQTTFNYDARDRMTKQTSPSGWGALSYTRLYGGQVSTVASSNGNGNSLTYEYDHLNRPSAIQDGGKTTTINYDGVGNISQIVLPNGVAVTYVYDNLNRLTAVKALLTSNSSFLTDFEYTLGPTGNRLSVTEVTGRAVTWTPDDLYRLTGENIAVDPSGNTGNVTYTYDSVGNRNQRTSTVSPIVSQNFTGAYTTADLLKPTFDFDDNGNQLTNGNGVTYTYNALNQLTRVQGTSLDVSYVYDGDGLRVQKTSNGITTNYLWDRNNLTGYPQVSEELQNGSVVRRYVYGPKGPLYMVQLVGSTWVTSYFGEDATGSVRFLMNDSGTVTDSWTWDAYGNLLGRTGTTNCALGFDGEYQDADTGLIYLRARWYDPSTGRFLQMDSYEGDNENPDTLNKFTFVGNDPLNSFDPTGHEKTTVEGQWINDQLLSSALPTHTAAYTNMLAAKYYKIVRCLRKVTGGNQQFLKVLASLIYSESNWNELEYNYNAPSDNQPYGSVDVGIGQINHELDYGDQMLVDEGIGLTGYYPNGDIEGGIKSAASVLQSNYNNPTLNKIYKRGYWLSNKKRVNLESDEKFMWFVAVFGYKGVNKGGHNNARLWLKNYYEKWPGLLDGRGKDLQLKRDAWYGVQRE